LKISITLKKCCR